MQDRDAIKESIAHALGELTSSMRSVERRMDQAEISRSKFYQRFDEMKSLMDARFDETAHRLAAVENRQGHLETRLADMEPSWKDYQIKLVHVKAAGTLGQILWRIGGHILTAAGGIAAAWLWLTGGKLPN